MLEETDDSAAEALAEKPDDQDTFYVPASAVPDHECAPGDTLKFEVIGKDKDGDIEVKFSGYEDGGDGDMEMDLRQSFAKKE